MSNDQVKDIEAETQNEIDQILNEVEELRRELHGQSEEMSTGSEPTVEAAAPQPAETDPLLNEFHATLTDGKDEGVDMESTLAELKDDSTLKTLLDQTFEDQEERAQSAPEAVPAFAETQPSPVSLSKEPSTVKKETSAADASPSLTMTLTGSMTLKLQYEFGGQAVSVGFSDDFLRIELADGTEFKIPVGKRPSLRSVA